MSDDFPLLDVPAGALRPLRAALVEAGFVHERVVERLGFDKLYNAQDKLTIVVHRTRAGAPLDTLIRLFLVSVPVDAAAARRAVAPTTLDAWIDAGLLQREGDAVSATVRLMPWAGLFLACDVHRRSAPDKVMSVAPSSLSVANTTIRRRSRLTLDLGTGSGVQALAAAAHSDRVLAVDKNPRAVRFTAWSARFNGLDHVECRVGDRFEPVQGERFDLIVANPPFVISPGVRYTYRDGGEGGDGFCRSIVREAPALLAEGGYCQLLCQWAHVAGEDWRARLAGWFAGSGCDAWVLRAQTSDLESYIEQWNDDRPAAGDFGFDAWMAYLEGAGIEAVSLGLIIMRRVSGRAGWLRIEDAPRLVGACGDTIHAGFTRQDFLAATDDAALLDARLVAAPGLRMAQESELGADGWEVASRSVQRTQGLAYESALDAPVAALLERLRAPRRLGDAVTELAEALGQSRESVALASVRAARGLLAQGFLEPA